MATFSLKAGVGADVSVGFVGSKTNNGKVKSCGLVSFCPSAGAIVQATGGVHKLYSSGEYNSGISASACATAAAGVGGAICPQITICSAPK